MLHCTACIQRCLRSIFLDALPHHALLKPPLRFDWTPNAPRDALWFRRRYATEAIKTRGHRHDGSNIMPVLATPHESLSNRTRREPSIFKEKDLGLELQWVKDPLKLSTKTVDLLRNDEYGKVVALLRLASREMDCTVSWNHLIDYDMTKGKVTVAIKKYNEMKKRAQPPDAYTYTILLRGLSWNIKSVQAVPRAISIYHSMFAENSPVRPSIIHTNAVLKVCALAGDMDALMGVAAKIPERGSAAPNKLTFTIVLNAIRNEANRGLPDEHGSIGGEQRRAEAVLKGRRLWEEIRDRWINGDLQLDEELACSMGRILLLGDGEQDLDDILSLIEQTMGISRQIPRRGDPARHGALRHIQAMDELQHSGDRANADLSIPFPNPSLTEASDHELPDNPFETSPKIPISQSLVTPGRNTLSLVLDACTRLRLPRLAQDYWGLLTSPQGWNITPDSENYHMYLRLQRLQRASKQTLDLVTEMLASNPVGAQGQSPRGVQKKTFRIALSTCARDKNNKHALGHANELVRMMHEKFETPDPKALSSYLSVALSHEPRDWRALQTAVRETDLAVKNLKSLIAYDVEGRRAVNQDEVVALMRMLIRAYDVLWALGGEEMTSAARGRCKDQKSALTAWITRNKSQKRGIRDPKAGRYRVDLTTETDTEDLADDLFEQTEDRGASTVPDRNGYSEYGAGDESGTDSGGFGDEAIGNAGNRRGSLDTGLRGTKGIWRGHDSIGYPRIGSPRDDVPTGRGLAGEEIWRNGRGGGSVREGSWR